MVATRDCQLKATAKYKKENLKTIPFQINRTTESELLAWLEKQENRQGYIKSLILADMRAKQTEST